MPNYEFSLIFRALSHPQLKSSIQRVLTGFLENEAIVYNLENLGARNLPYRMTTKAGVECHAGHYILAQCYLPSSKVQELLTQTYLEYEIIRTDVAKLDIEPIKKCHKPIPDLILNKELGDYTWNYKGNFMESGRLEDP